ncbi:MAG: hypothetical protein WAZ94_13575 [Phycisphaerales bacterium]
MIGRLSHAWAHRTALVLAPVALVKLGGLLLGVNGPDHAAAVEPSPDESPSHAPVAPNAEIEAWEESVMSGPALRSPMVEPSQEHDPSPEAPVQAATTPPAPGVEHPALLLSAVSGGRGSASAAIVNGRLRRVGEAVAPGYRLVSVDAAGRSARVEGPDGTVIVLLIQR